MLNDCCHFVDALTAQRPGDVAVVCSTFSHRLRTVVHYVPFYPPLRVSRLASFQDPEHSSEGGFKGIKVFATVS